MEERGEAEERSRTKKMKRRQNFQKMIVTLLNTETSQNLKTIRD